MERVQCDRRGRIQYYGMQAGYLQGNGAVLDPIFHTGEMDAFLQKRGLRAEWEPGLFDRMARDGFRLPEESPPLRDCRVWQLRPEVDVRKKFIPYQQLVRRFGEPDRKDYRPAYDGAVTTNDLEELYECFRENPPHGFDGYPLAISDVLELYDEQGSNCWYLDQSAFRRIGFAAPTQTPSMRMDL